MHSLLIPKRAQTILDYWFAGLQAAEPPSEEQMDFWFRRKDPKVDAYLRENFLADLEQAAAGELEHWQETASGTLALILLLDQFPRHIYRDQPNAFSNDTKALSISRNAVQSGMDQQLSFVERIFCYLPFVHSEALATQREAVRLAKELLEKCPEVMRPVFEESYVHVKRHCEIIERFGRFPHRNSILGRVSTAEEHEFLQQPNSSF